METSYITSISTHQKRAEQLQFLRFLAFLNIFTYHAEAWNFLNYPTSHCGAFAVSFFFMLSGLVTGYSRYGREIYPSLQNICKDMTGKIRKIYPVYFVLILFTLMTTGVPLMLSQGDNQRIWDLVIDTFHSLLMLQAWPGVDGTLWFLSAILFLYLFNLPALWLAAKAKGHRFRYIYWGGAFLALMVITVLYCRMTQHTSMGYWHNVFPPARMGEYLGGLLLGYSIRDFDSQPILKRIPSPVFTFAEISAIIFWLFSLPRAGNYWMNYIVSWLIPNTFLLAVFTFGGGWLSKLFRLKPLVYLGNISFECYVLHHTIIRRYLIHNYVETETVATQIFSYLYCLLLTLLTASVFHKSIRTKKT